MTLQQNHIQPVVLVIIKKANKFLLTVRAEHNRGEIDFCGWWQIPGGGLEFAESVEQCAIREAKEELGIDVRTKRIITPIYHDVRDKWHGLLIPFECELVNSKDQIVLNHESSEYGWFTLEEIKKLKLMPKCLEIIEVSCARERT